MNTRSRSAHLCDVHYIPRNSIKSKTSKSSASHLARAQNFKKNCRLFTYNNSYFRSSKFKSTIHANNEGKNKALKPQKGKNPVLKIACWNIRSLKYSNEGDYSKNIRKQPNDKRPLLVKEVKKLNIDIICLSETRLLGQNNLEIDGYVLLWSGKEDKHQNGVAVLARKELLQGIDIHHNVKFVSDRIIQLNLYIDDQRTSVLSVYAPTNSYDIDDKLEFYDKLHELTSDIPRDTRLFICGDFNARVGRPRKKRKLMERHPWKFRIRD